MWFRFRFRFMVSNATFNNVSVISLRSVSVVKEMGILGENHPPVADKMYHKMLY